MRRRSVGPLGGVSGKIDMRVWLLTLFAAGAAAWAPHSLPLRAKTFGLRATSSATARQHRYAGPVRRPVLVSHWLPAVC